MNSILLNMLTSRRIQLDIYICKHCNLKCRYCSRFCNIADKEFYEYSDLSICKVGDMWDTLVKRVKKFIPDIAMTYDHSQIGYKSVCTDRDTFRTCLINQQNYRGIDIYSILGGKITNVFNMFDDLKSTL